VQSSYDFKFQHEEIISSQYNFTLLNDLIGLRFTIFTFI